LRCSTPTASAEGRNFSGSALFEDVIPSTIHPRGREEGCREKENGNAQREKKGQGLAAAFQAPQKFIGALPRNGKHVHMIPAKRWTRKNGSPNMRDVTRGSWMRRWRFWEMPAR
jgi:hypothetical protein